MDHCICVLRDALYFTSVIQSWGPRASPLIVRCMYDLALAACRPEVLAGHGQLGPAGQAGRARGRVAGAQPADIRLHALAPAPPQLAHRPRGQAHQAPPAAQQVRPRVTESANRAPRS
eukprot:8611529-Pyramimonas_sp.AAC.1